MSGTMPSCSSGILHPSVQVLTSASITKTTLSTAEVWCLPPLEPNRPSSSSTRRDFPWSTSTVPGLLCGFFSGYYRLPDGLNQIRRSNNQLERADVPTTNSNVQQHNTIQRFLPTTSSESMMAPSADLEEQKHRVQFLNKPANLEAPPTRKPMDLDPESRPSSHRAESVSSNDDSSSAMSLANIRRKSNLLIISLIICLGVATCSAFLAVGITSSVRDKRDLFTRRADDLVNRIQRSWEDYVTATSWMHGRCRGRNFTRADFRAAFEYLNSTTLNFQAVQFDPNITHEERPAAEEEARKFYEDYPTVNYTGFRGFNHDNSTTLESRLEAPFYFPIHFMEPVVGNERAIDLDYHASGSRKQTVMFCMNNGLPALTDRLVLVQEKKLEIDAFGVVLMHPGIELSAGEGDEVWPRDLASIVIRIPDLLRRAAEDTGVPAAIYIYDASEYAGGPPRFLGGAEIRSDNEQNTGEPELVILEETELEVLRHKNVLRLEDVVNAANKKWIVVVHSADDSYDPDIAFVVFGGVLIFLASVCLAYWIHANSKRMDAFNQVKQQADMERASLILESARQATKAERELNDFIAHEVRNPVAAAMSACSFVKNAVNEEVPLSTEEGRRETREDVEIIDNALRFVNDLLRNMLDMHRAANKQLKVNMIPTDLLHDVLEPVQAMLPQRETKFELLVDCPSNLVVITDRLRLKQVCLNLARNSLKFVDEGFIRLKACVVNGEVNICIEDSGPGIPPEKRTILFSKFQESLDSLSQGTGIGLFLCQNLVSLMDGEIYLDDSYQSGFKNYPGTRFVVNLKREAIDPLSFHDFHPSSCAGTGETHIMDDDDSSVPELPASLSVLFVDDDPILRKLFTRTVRTVAPDWRVREASNGETALRLVKEDSFDLIFMDMYMASVEKQLLGTETVRELRKRGIKCRICGLSANDKEAEFLEAGADVFTFKPFPCEAKALTQELIRVLYREEL